MDKSSRSEHETRLKMHQLSSTRNQEWGGAVRAGVESTDYSVEYIRLLKAAVAPRRIEAEEINIAVPTQLSSEY